MSLAVRKIRRQIAAEARSAFSFLTTPSNLYKVSHLLVDWVGPTEILSVPLSARFCLD